MIRHINVHWAFKLFELLELSRVGGERVSNSRHVISTYRLGKERENALLPGFKREDVNGRSSQIKRYGSRDGVVELELPEFGPITLGDVQATNSTVVACHDDNLT